MFYHKRFFVFVIVTAPVTQQLIHQTTQAIIPSFF